MENVYENVAVSSNKAASEANPAVVNNNSNSSHLAGQTVIEILDEMIGRLESEDEEGKRLAEVKGQAANDLLEMVKVVFPLVVDLQVDTVAQHGFPANIEGLTQFLKEANVHLQEESEHALQIRQRLMKIRHFYLPP